MELERVKHYLLICAIFETRNRGQQEGGRGGGGGGSVAFYPSPGASNDTQLSRCYFGSLVGVI